MQRRTKFMVVASTLFVAMFAAEQFRSADLFGLWNFAFDVVEMALLIGAVAMIGFVSAETRDIRIERLELLDDLETARRESGLTSRSQVTSFFLEDLLMPAAPVPMPAVSLVERPRG